MGQIMRVEGLLMLFPLICALIYKENPIPFLVPIAMLLLFGTLLAFNPTKNRDFTARDGFITVGLAWIVLSLFGALPFYLCGKGLSFIDCFFETVSGFTTTGASILGEGSASNILISEMQKGILFWRSFTHFIGGMGVLVFVLAILPSSDTKGTQLMHLMRAEVPGPKVDKIVSKLTHTARILYTLYVVLTVFEVVLLLCGGMPLFDSLVNSFGTAGTGGFSSLDNSIGGYNSPYFEWVIGIFMMLFGINFNVYYLILCGQVGKALKSEELRWYLIIMLGSAALIAYNVFTIYGNLSDTVRHSFFQVSSIMTTTGYGTTDFNAWPTLSKLILTLLMFIGACSGSTGGGIKVGRIIMLIKNGIREMRYAVQPRSVIAVRFEGKRVEHETVRGTTSFLIIYLLIFIFSIIAIAALNSSLEFIDAFTGVTACLNNIGPGFGSLYSTFGGLSPVSKLILSFNMLAGRLELFPILMLFSPSVWKRK